MNKMLKKKIRLEKSIVMGLTVLLTGLSGVLAQENIHFHGYGELHYSDTNKKGDTDKIDFHRMVLGWSYIFDDRMSLHVEVDFEHASTEMELEFAYLDFKILDAINIRAGSMLMPVGYLNEFHEPPLFFSVERPYVQKYIIPTTWQEGGAGIFGYPHPDVNYRLYVVGGLDASSFKGSSGIRSGRKKVAGAPAEDKAVVGRVDYSGLPFTRVGGSFYTGDSAQGDETLGDAGVGLFEADIRFKMMGVELTGLFAQISIDDTDKINAETGEVIGKKILGWYMEGAYHIGKLFMPVGQDIVLFVRHEQFNTQEDVVSSLTADKANDRRVTTSGLTYYPIKKIAIKADVERWENGKNEDWTQINLGVSYMF